MARRIARRLVPLLLALAALGACTALDSAGEPEMADEGPTAAGDAPAAEPVPDAERPADDTDADADEASAGPPLPPAARQAASTPERVVKEGTVTLEVDEGGFMSAYERVVETARRQGGSVAASTSATDEQGRTTGSVTVRVPVENYENLLVAVARIAEPVAQDIRSEEVTGQIVDLEARLRHLRAQEGFYLGLLEDAVEVRDAIAVQQQVDDIQQRIEQLQGRLDHLENRADYSTLTVEIVEAGAEHVAGLARPDEPTLAGYWEHARNGFVTLVGWSLVVAVTLSPIAVPLLLAYLAWRVSRRRAATVVADAD